ncbi:RagB/SusD family nutrient uptake outer membrane protein [Flavobacterium aquicola]|uniref:Putative outer membrane starch-binding protein n=1 Tax=Flavobacterium aquicola TaxID=1682742 RepID=A0A3E0ERV4_9FLAO|nr:RagB/SusD family nutrient uptake outer membrane protein [Flavobacterium aquicola]REH00963.1 putative outer membrane starch-binding protein [Flavobacterium aquicola]
MKTDYKIKYTVQLLSLCFVVVFLNSCSDYLNEQPISQPSNVTFWRNGEDANAAVAGGYSQLRKALNSGLSYYAHGDLGTDYFSTEKELRSDFTDIMKFKLGISVAVTDNWKPMYKVRDFSIFYSAIKQADLCLKHIPEIPKEEFTEYESQYNQYIGEAYFIKAFSYFYMARVWGNVPIIDSSDPDVVDIKNYKREDVAKVLIKATEDCQQAIKHLAWDYNVDTDKVVRANAGAAWALLAHIQAWSGNYAACEAAAGNVINSNFYSYIDRNNYIDIFSGQSRESIFEIAQNSEKEAQAGNGQSLTNYLLRGEYLKTRLNEKETIWQYDLTTLKQTLFDNPNDLRRTKGFAEFSSDWPILLKYSKVMYASPTSPLSINNIVVFRLADIALLQAEAQAAQGKYTEARTTLNSIREKAGLEESNAANDKLFEAVIQERGRELFMEGHRFYDLVRLAREKKVYKFGDSSSNKITPSQFENGKSYWPIQPTLIETNILFTQTEYWKSEAQ